ncbi:MAG: prepilin-type N-terminal cleavage/methylation domain-containing protein [Opitutales bacterium]|nr:prepilin-type N-terminal cleavage/methylation domain-containing protein [Opitutales bacterium]
MLQNRRQSRKQGFTLVEMMVGLTLLGVFMTGIFGSVRLSTLISESTIYDNTAMLVAQSHLEQIKSLPYEEVLLASQDPSNVTLKAINPYYDDQLNMTVQDAPLSLDPSQQPNQRTVKLTARGDGNNSSIDMPVNMTVTVVDKNTGTNPVEALEIKIVYSYQLPDVMGGNWVTKQVQTIRARI